MSGRSRWVRAWHILLIAALALLSALAAAPQVSAVAQVGASSCAVAKTDAKTGAARWLEGCGKIDVKGTPEAIARGALAPRTTALGLRADGSDLTLLKVTPTTTATYIRFAQTHKGIPVYLGQVLVQYSPAGDLQLINNHTLPNLNVDVNPTISADTATGLAQAAVTGQQRAPSTHELAIYGDRGAPVLAWHITTFTRHPAGDWHVMVAAKNGKVLSAWNAIKHDTGKVYDPNPVQQTGDTSLVDNGDATSAALDNARQDVTLNNLNPSIQTIKGSYADMTGTGISQAAGDCDLPYTPGQASDAGRNYVYDRSDDRFEEVNAYYAIDGVQSWFQALGFTNVNNRSIPVDVHCYAPDNSFYSSADHALHFGDGGVDDAEDADIVIHEYGHSVQDNQVPGFAPGGNTEQGAIGEGFGDFLAGMYYVNKGNATHQNTYKYCIGEWDATEYNAVVPGNSGSGCLRWIDGRDENDGSDLGAYSGTPTEVHNDGRFWSAAMTCIYEGLGANPTARDNIIKLILTHHFSLTPDASDNAFEDSVAALLVADQALFGGIHQALINSCALARGLISEPKLPNPTLTSPVGGEIFPPGSTVNITWDTAGAPASATYTLEYTANCGNRSFLDNMEHGVNGWTTSHISGTLNWTQVTSDSFSPTHSWFAGDEDEVNDQYLVSPQFTVGISQELSFAHHYDLEDASPTNPTRGYDGGVVEISTNGGASWTDLGPQMIQNGYNHTISSAFSSPIAGRQAFSGDSGGWIETLANLNSLAGQSARLRFREADDESVSVGGWRVDDVRVGAPLSWTLIVTTTAGASSYNWVTPNVPGSYCVRIRGQASGFRTSDYDQSQPFSLGAKIFLPLVRR